MKHNLIPIVFGLLTSLLMTTDGVAQDWSQFRGPGGRSSAMQPSPAELVDSMIWKVETPAKGASGPIVVGDRIVLTCSGNGEKQDELFTVCYDAGSGKELWRQQLWATGRTFCHELSANAAPTPASDGENVFVFYSSNELASLRLDDGSLNWFRALGMEHPRAGNDVGMSSSPVVHDGVVMVQCEGPGDSFLEAFDTATGETLWSLEREKSASWASPLVVQAEGNEPLVVVQSSGLLTVNDLKTGEEIYRLEGEVNSIPSASFQDGVIFAPVNGITAFELTDENEIEELWTGAHIKPGSASGVVSGDSLYTLNRAGVFFRYDLDSGDETGSVRVNGQYWATPAISGRHAYFFTQDGTGKVLDLEKMEIVHEHNFGDDEVFLGSPAVSGGALFMRSDKFLYKFAEKDAT